MNHFQDIITISDSEEENETHLEDPEYYGTQPEHEVEGVKDIYTREKDPIYVADAEKEDETDLEDSEYNPIYVPDAEKEDKADLEDSEYNPIYVSDSENEADVEDSEYSGTQPEHEVEAVKDNYTREKRIIVNETKELVIKREDGAYDVVKKCCVWIPDVSEPYYLKEEMDLVPIECEAVKEDVKLRNYDNKYKKIKPANQQIKVQKSPNAKSIEVTTVTCLPSPKQISHDEAHVFDWDRYKNEIRVKGVIKQEASDELKSSCVDERLHSPQQTRHDDPRALDWDQFKIEKKVEGAVKQEPSDELKSSCVDERLHSPQQTRHDDPRAFDWDQFKIEKKVEGAVKQEPSDELKSSCVDERLHSPQQTRHDDPRALDWDQFKIEKKVEGAVKQEPSDELKSSCVDERLHSPQQTRHDDPRAFDWDQFKIEKKIEGAVKQEPSDKLESSYVGEHLHLAQYTRHDKCHAFDWDQFKNEKRSNKVRKREAMNHTTINLKLIFPEKPALRKSSRKRPIVSYRKMSCDCCISTQCKTDDRSVFQSDLLQSGLKRKRSNSKPPKNKGKSHDSKTLKYRENHNYSERMRRLDLANYFSDLMRQLPKYQSKRVNSKVSILQEATRYINQLEKEEKALSKVMFICKKQQMSLKAELFSKHASNS